MWRESIVMIEEIPLTFIIYDTVMICPAAVLVLRHYDSLVFVWSHRILAHSIAENLSILPHIRIRKVIIAVIFECKRTFGLTARKSLKAVHTYHLELTVTPSDGIPRIVFGKFLHIVLEFGTASVTPEQVCVSI